MLHAGSSCKDVFDLLDVVEDRYNMVDRDVDVDGKLSESRLVAG